MESKEKARLFMYAFMYDLELNLKGNLDLLKNITFHADEANMDKDLKIFLKGYIMEKFNKLPDSKSDHSLSLILDRGQTSAQQSYPYSEFSALYVSQVYLPSELTEELKENVRKVNKLFVNPDLLLEIREESSEEIAYIPVELKSTKKDAILGSSVQQVTPDEWVFFIKHTAKSVSITVGQYVNSINQTMQFPDRSPRPSVSFTALNEHNENHRREENKELIYFDEEKSLFRRHELLKDWQGILVERWLEVIEREEVKKNEPWFNNTIRRYTLDFISMYEELSDEERTKFKIKLRDTIGIYNQNHSE